MSRLAEEVVEEWLNRKGYFTIRGVKLGVDEIDLLAIRPTSNGDLEQRHLEVQVSVRPVSYICRVPKEVQRATGKAANSAKRSEEELVTGVAEWVQKKYDKPNKVSLMQRLAPGSWSRELVTHNVKSEAEVNLIVKHDVRILRLANIVADLHRGNHAIASASGSGALEETEANILASRGR